MSNRICPNCGNAMPGTATSCQCGFIWTEGADMPAPDIVRSAVGQPSAVDQVPATNNLAVKADREDVDMELPPFPWEKNPRATASPKPASPRPGVIKTSDTPAKATPAPGARKVQPAMAAKPGSTPARPNTALLMACPTCEAAISRRAASCPKCKSAPYNHCLICATRLLVSSEVCSECGDPAPFTAPVGGDA